MTRVVQPRRAIVSYETFVAAGKKWRMTLACGHVTVRSKRGNACVCAECPPVLHSQKRREAEREPVWKRALRDRGSLTPGSSSA